MAIPSLQLEGKVAIVTGGGTGIGRAIALEFAKAGANVVVASRRMTILERAVEQIRALNRRSLAVQTDIGRKTQVDNLIDRTVNEFGRIDVMVNNSAIGSGGKHLLDLPEEEWDRTMDINLKGYFLCCQAAGRKMVEQRSGNIINISSTSGLSTDRGESSPYNIAKAGVIMLTRCLAWELGPYNIRVNAIAPGYVKTDMTERLWSDPQILKQIASRRPLGRVGEPDQIGTIALFLASDASSNVTGHTIIADGGLTA